MAEQVLVVGPAWHNQGQDGGNLIECPQLWIYSVDPVYPSHPPPHLCILQCEQVPLITPTLWRLTHPLSHRAES